MVPAHDISKCRGYTADLRARTAVSTPELATQQPARNRSNVNPSHKSTLVTLK